VGVVDKTHPSTVVHTVGESPEHEVYVGVPVHVESPVVSQ